ncbi:hypothetical protein AVEN_138040-1 [Araneus ventricosus]|uniref:Uncharacterized protein n=1 Tax=Araneus ventricosus TaxID=182803 RepID=A0A4Y2V9D2_ARAVE|nr:hypothetical protein AVEN_138040-1 [Araneus ventricosus]
MARVLNEHSSTRHSTEDKKLEDCLRAIHPSGARLKSQLIEYLLCSSILCGMSTSVSSQQPPIVPFPKESTNGKAFQLLSGGFDKIKTVPERNVSFSSQLMFGRPPETTAAKMEKF